MTTIVEFAKSVFEVNTLAQTRKKVVLVTIKQLSGKPVPEEYRPLVAGRIVTRLCDDGVIPKGYMGDVRI